MKLEARSIGVGDRFGRQGRAQLQAVLEARDAGCEVVPVWNKSHREHTIIGTAPADVRREADAAVQALDWNDSYYVDADHIGPSNVDLFVESSDFFTLDVAEAIGQAAAADAIDAFVRRHERFVGELQIPGLDPAPRVTREDIRAIAAKYVHAVDEAARTYGIIAERKGVDRFVTEVSMDETNEPQTPVELFFILAAIAAAGVPAQTIAPKFSGRFNKGVDYVGDVSRFAREFEDDVRVIAAAVREFDLPSNLKLSVHSGSDKFSLYPEIARILRACEAGVHLKTAGTTWLEELIGLALAGGDGLDLARDVYRRAHGRFDELCGPYATVIDIDPARLPEPGTVDGWSAADFAAALRHDQACDAFNPDFRQMLHVAYKVAAEMGDRYLDALNRHEAVVTAEVKANLWERHLQPLFIAG